MAEIRQEIPTPFLISRGAASGAADLARKLLWRGAERLSGLRRCHQLYERLEGQCPAGEFSRRALELLQVEYTADAQLLRRIPAQGACILIANHPFGGIEGLMLFDLLN